MKSCWMRSVGRWSRRKITRRIIPPTSTCSYLSLGINCCPARSGSPRPTTTWTTPSPASKMQTQELSSSHGWSTLSYPASPPKTLKRRLTRARLLISRTSLSNRRRKSGIWRICTWDRSGWSQNSRKLSGSWSTT